MSAALPSSRAERNAPPIRSAPRAVASAIWLLQPGQCLGEVFVAPAAQAQEVVSRIRLGGSGNRRIADRGIQQPRDRVGGLEGRQDSLQASQLAKCAQRI